MTAAPELQNSIRISLGPDSEAYESSLKPYGVSILPSSKLRREQMKNWLIPEEFVSEKAWVVVMEENATRLPILHFDLSGQVEHVVVLVMKTSSSARVIATQSEGATLFLRSILMEKSHLELGCLDQTRLASAQSNQFLFDVAANAHLGFFRLDVSDAHKKWICEVNLSGVEASTHIGAAAVSRGEQILSGTIKVRHLVESTCSRQIIKGIATESGALDVLSRVEIFPGAQKSDSMQLGRSLLMGERSSALIKPELDVAADDVKAKHGAAIGSLSAEEIFYLQSRGLTFNEANQALLNGFLLESIESASAEFIIALRDLGWRTASQHLPTLEAAP